jgi:hypothetical protein
MNSIATMQCGRHVFHSVLDPLHRYSGKLHRRKADENLIWIQMFLCPEPSTHIASHYSNLVSSELQSGRKQIPNVMRRLGRHPDSQVLVTGVPPRDDTSSLHRTRGNALNPKGSFNDSISLGYRRFDLVPGITGVDGCTGIVTPLWVEENVTRIN